MTVLIQSFLDFLGFVLFFYSEWNFGSVDINTPVWKTKAKSELRTEFKIIGGEKILFIFDGKFTIMVGLRRAEFFKAFLFRTSNFKFLGRSFRKNRQSFYWFQNFNFGRKNRRSRGQICVKLGELLLVTCVRSKTFFDSNCFRGSRGCLWVLTSLVRDFLKF